MLVVPVVAVTLLSLVVVLPRIVLLLTGVVVISIIVVGSGLPVVVVIVSVPGWILIVATLLRALGATPLPGSAPGPAPISTSLDHHNSAVLNRLVGFLQGLLTRYGHGCVVAIFLWNGSSHHRDQLFLADSIL